MDLPHHGSLNGRCSGRRRSHPTAVILLQDALVLAISSSDVCSGVSLDTRTFSRHHHHKRSVQTSRQTSYFGGYDLWWKRRGFCWLPLPTKRLGSWWQPLCHLSCSPRLGDLLLLDLSHQRLTGARAPRPMWKNRQTHACRASSGPVTCPSP